VFHEQFDGLERSLADRPGLLRDHEKAFQALQARSFNPALIERIQVEHLESEWTKACKSPWPFSFWRRSKARKKIKAYMTAEGAAEPEIDLPLLREYKDFRQRVAANLASLGLPPHLASKVEKETGALDTQIQASLHLRAAIGTAGLTPADVGKASQGTFKPLLAAARRLFPPGQEVKSLRAKLQENLDTLELSPELKAAVETDATALSGQIHAARSIREAATALGLSGEDLSQTLRAILDASGPLRRDTAAEYCRSAKAFHNAWVEYNKHAASPPVDKDSDVVIADAAAQANEVLSRRTVLKQWTAWMGARERAQQLGLSAFVDALQSHELGTKDAFARFELAYARWWLPAIVDQCEPLRAFQRFLHEGAIDEFRRLDDTARQAAAPRVRHSAFHGLPPSDQVPVSQNWASCGIR
jgi:hypothetical protein